MAYMRQDMAFTPGEAVSQRIVGQFLSTIVDAIVSVDPHLHRVATLQELVPGADAVVLTGAEVLADLIVQQRPNGLAGRTGWRVGTVGHAGRQAPRTRPCVSAPRCAAATTMWRWRCLRVDVAGRAVVILDDMASTGHTIAAAARLLRDAGAASIDAAVTHALFTPQAMDLMRDSGIGEVWSTDCIAHASNAVHMAPLLAGALAQLQAARRRD